MDTHRRLEDLLSVQVIQSFPADRRMIMKAGAGAMESCLRSEQNLLQRDSTSLSGFAGQHLTF